MSRNLDEDFNFTLENADQLDGLNAFRGWGMRQSTARRLDKSEQETLARLAAFSKIRERSVLSYFPADFLDMLSAFGETRTYPQGEWVLRESEMNSEFYFLLFGSVEIVFGNTVTYQLNDVGEIFGEMSLIAEAPCTASVRTLEDSCFLVFKHQEIKAIVDRNREEFGFAMYQVFSKVLTKRLMEANQKAGLVEEKNKELKRLSREMELVAHERFQELWGKGNVTYDRLERVYREDLKALMELVEAEERSVPVATILPRLRKIQDDVKPIFEMYSRDVGCAQKKVLLAEPDKKYQGFTKTALVGAGVSLAIVETYEEAFKVLNQESFDILLMSPELVRASELAHAVNPEMKQVLIVKGDKSESLRFAEYFQSYPFINNVVSLHGTARIFTLRNIFTTVGKLAHGDLFGLEKYLNWGAEVKKMPVEGSQQRQEILKKMEHYFAEAGLRQAVLDRCKTVAEEMLMNVIYDAPTDGSGKALYNNVSRTKTVALDVHQKGEFHFACDGVMAAIAVQDPFGSLERDTLLKYLSTCEKGESAIDGHGGKGGGGMGTHLIVASSDLTIFNVRPGLKTEVIALFNIDRQAEKFFSSSSFHLFFG